ncbi:MAG: T9SS type A sorting domain-containing protein, partial [Flavobacteriaceae bacterium]|nr:T9SS type A sorting domain-containing protein [Flavobacteriaceae bacterium]
MKKILFSLVAFSLAGIAAAQTQAPAIEWQKCLGGSGGDMASSIQQTSDGGYIVAGITNSNDGDVSGNHGNSDGWVVKLNPSGEIDWQKCLGGSDYDSASSIQQTSDGGYIVAGRTSSNDGDVSGNHGGNSDGWVVKLDASGAVQWQKCLGGSNSEVFNAIQQTSDGGYIVAGYTNSNDGDVSGNHGSDDFWVVKLNASGELLWQKCLGGSGQDSVYSIQQTSDGGYIAAGFTTSNDGDVSGFHGGYYDGWVVKLDASGNLLWQKCLGGSGFEDWAYSIQQTSDGGYIVAGYTSSNDGDVSGFHGGYDGWVVKLDTSGKLLWQKCLGGSDWDFLYSIQQTSDGGYIVAGYTISNDGDVSENNGNYHEAWIVKLDASENLLWQKCLGGSYYEVFNSIQQTSDGGYIVAGFTNSYDGDVSGNHGDLDGWVVKLAPDNLGTEELSVNAKIGVYPNPVRDVLHFTSKEPVLKAEIFDLNGRLIKTAEVFNNQLSVSSLSKGIYFLNLQTAKEKLKT